MKTFREFIAMAEATMYPDFDKGSLKPRDRTKPYWTLVHRKTNQILKSNDQHSPGFHSIHYFKSLADAETHRYSLASRMNEYYPRRETAQIFTGTGKHPDEVIINPKYNNYPPVVDFT